VDPLPPGPGPKDKMGTHLALKSQLLEPLFSFPAWGVGNIILIFPPTLSCHTKILALKKKKKNPIARYRWVTSVIVTTWEAGIGKIKVQSQSR
jgi:hypothetical protein